MLREEYIRLRTMVSDGAGRIQMQSEDQQSGFGMPAFAPAE